MKKTIDCTYLMYSWLSFFRCIVALPNILMLMLLQIQVFLIYHNLLLILNHGFSNRCMIIKLSVLIQCTIAEISWDISYEMLLNQLSLWVCTLDENSARTTAGGPVVALNTEKPDKFANRFYCGVSTAHIYVHCVIGGE